jgi:hypothetical protein
MLLRELIVVEYLRLLRSVLVHKSNFYPSQLVRSRFVSLSLLRCCQMHLLEAELLVLVCVVLHLGYAKDARYGRVPYQSSRYTTPSRRMVCRACRSSAPQP